MRLSDPARVRLGSSHLRWRRMRHFVLYSRDTTASEAQIVHETVIFDPWHGLHSQIGLQEL